MRKLITIGILAALLAGCASDDPYEGRGSTAPAPTDTEMEEGSFPRPRGSTPGTHPNDPRGGTGADDFGGTDSGTPKRSP
jgi:hypothetical protein